MKIDVAIFEDDMGLFSIYEESGQALEVDFETKEEATKYANDQGWNILGYFNLSLL